MRLDTLVASGVVAACNIALEKNLHLKSSYIVVARWYCCSHTDTAADHSSSSCCSPYSIRKRRYWVQIDILYIIV